MQKYRDLVFDETAKMDFINVHCRWSIVAREEHSSNQSERPVIFFLYIKRIYCDHSRTEVLDVIRDCNFFVIVGVCLWCGRRRKTCCDKNSVKVFIISG